MQAVQQQLTEDQLEVVLLKERIAELTSKLKQSNNVIANLPTELDMAGPSLKLYFKNEEERHIVTMVAARYQQTLKEFSYNCIIANVNGFLEQQQAAAAAQQEQDNGPESDVEAVESGSNDAADIAEELAEDAAGVDGGTDGGE